MRIKNHWEEAARYLLMMREEEKRVKQIDFSKPLQTDQHKHFVRVVQEGMTLVEVTDSFGADGVYAIDEYGKVQSWQTPNHKNFGQGVKFENKPEEPKDTIVLMKASNGKYFVSAYNEIRGYATPITASEARAHHGANDVFVKVPV